MTRERRERKSSRPPKDFRQDFTNLMITHMQNQEAPWQKSWSPIYGFPELPKNPFTNRPFPGANTLNLIIQMQDLGTTDPRFLTYKQAQEQGYQVIRGSKATTVEYWKFENNIPEPFYANVFHAFQIEDLPNITLKEHTEIHSTNEIQTLLTKANLEISYDLPPAAKANESNNIIHLSATLATADNLERYAAILPTLTHWAGHKDRLNRNLAGQYGTHNHAREELRNQIVVFYLSVEIGLPFTPTENQTLNNTYIKLLQNDKNEIFRIAKDAELITEYILALSREKTNYNIMERLPVNPNKPIVPVRSTRIKRVIDHATPLDVTKESYNKEETLDHIRTWVGVADLDYISKAEMEVIIKTEIIPYLTTVSEKTYPDVAGILSISTGIPQEDILKIIHKDIFVNQIKTNPLEVFNRWENIKNIEPKLNPRQKESTPEKEYQHHAKQHVQDDLFKFSDTTIDKKIATTMLTQGYKKHQVERSIRESSPIAAIRPKIYPKILVEQTLQEIKNNLKNKSTGR